MDFNAECLNKQIFWTLGKFVTSLKNSEHPQSIFPHFRDCIRQLLSDEQVCKEFYSQECRLLFGSVVHSLLSIFKQKQQDKAIRLESGRLLASLFAPKYENCADSASIAFVLPGVVITCTGLISSEPSSQFVETVLDILRNIITTALNDRLVRRLQKVPDCEENGKFALRRDREFFGTNAVKLVESLQILIKHVAGSQSERHRLKLIELIEELARNCSTLFANTKFFQLRLNSAVRFSADEWQNISLASKTVIEQMRQLDPDSFFEISQASINSSLASVIEKKSNSSDALKMLSQFMGALSANQLKKLFKPKRGVKNTFKRLRKALEMLVDVDLKRIVASKNDIFETLPLKDTMRVEHLDRILTCLVRAGLGAHFFRCIGNSLRSKAKSARIFSSLILAHLCKIMSKEKETHPISKTFTIVVQNHLVYVWLKHLGAFIEKEPDPSNSDPIETSSLWHTRESAGCCALLACLSYSMQLMNPKRRDFQRLLVDVLYTLLQFLPSTNFACSSASHVALDLVAKTCNQSVDEFLGENADRVVYKAAMQAGNLKKYPRSPFALSALLDRGYGRGMVDQLTNLIPELLCGISTEDSAKIVPCLKAMRSFVLTITKWFPDLTQSQPKIDDIEEENVPILSDSDSENDENETDGHDWDRLERLREKFERQRQKNSDAIEQQKDLRSVSDDAKLKPPPLIKCVHMILERVQHLHHSPFPYTRLLLSHLICDALRFIREFKDQLLPMVHQNWVPMIISIRRTLLQNSRNVSKSMSSPDKLIVVAELRSVVCMCEVSGSFVYSKIFNELDEPLYSWMKDAAVLSQRTASVYSHSANFKLQSTILECWPIYCELAEIPSDRALEIMQLYADDKLQNAKLRELAKKGLDKLNEIRQRVGWMFEFFRRLWASIIRKLMDLNFIGINPFRTPELGEFTYLLGCCFCTSDTKEIQESSQSILWFTYRTNFPAIGGDGPTSDRGWGCMLRCGQMLLAHALKVVHLGRSWQWKIGSTDENYRRMLRMFQDKRSSLFSLQQIAQMGVNEGKALCQWFGPNTIAQCLKKLAIYDGWSQLAVHVAMDNLLISSDVKVLAATPWSDCTEPDDEKRQKIDENNPEKPWRPVLILVPLRLGLSAINREYLKPLQEFFKLPQCCGILGGRPNHAVFFTGFSGEELYYLDPHTAQPAVDLDNSKSLTPPIRLNVPKPEEDIVLIEENVKPDIAWPIDDTENTEDMQESNDSKSSNTTEDEFNDESFHCADLLHMHFDSLDPSLALGFICKFEDDFNDLIVQLKEKVLPLSKPAIFELLDVRPKNWPEYVPYTRANTTSGEATDKDYEDFADPTFDSGDEFEILQ